MMYVYSFHANGMQKTLPIGNQNYCDLAQNGNIVAIFVEVRRFTANQESEGSEVWGGVIRLYLASPEINTISITPLKKVSGEKFLLNFASQQQFKQF